MLFEIYQRYEPNLLIKTDFVISQMSFSNAWVALNVSRLIFCMFQGLELKSYWLNNALFEINHR